MPAQVYLKASTVTSLVLILRIHLPATWFPWKSFPVLNKKWLCFPNITRMLPFVMDLTNHGAPTHYWADLGQTFAYIMALNTLLGTSYWKALIIHFCLSRQSRKLVELPASLTSSKRYSIVSKWLINSSASFQMRSYDSLLCHELPWQIIAFGIQFNKGTNSEQMADWAFAVPAHSITKLSTGRYLHGVKEKEVGGGGWTDSTTHD